jgi:Flp pilus assembly protein TadB
MPIIALAPLRVFPAPKPTNKQSRCRAQPREDNITDQPAGAGAQECVAVARAALVVALAAAAAVVVAVAAVTAVVVLIVMRVVVALILMVPVLLPWGCVAV